MTNILLTMEYNGQAYAGWQLQPNAPTIQGEIERALADLYKTPVRLHGSGRTDSGVHAVMQTANFKVDTERIPVEAVPKALNARLNRDIRITRAEVVPDDFNARYSATARTYCYIIREARVASAFFEPFTWRIYRTLDVARMNEYANALIGEHDFSSFCSKKDESNSKTRKLFSLGFRRKGEFVFFFIKGNAFLHNMIRIIMGTIELLEREKKPPSIMQEILLAKMRNDLYPTAPAAGLFLKKVHYNDV